MPVDSGLRTRDSGLIIRRMAETYVVRRAVFSIEDPWAVPPQTELVRLRRATDGAPLRLATSVVAYFDSDFLTVVFSGADDLTVATHFDHDAPLYEEDVVEVFLAPRVVSQYFEIEVSPRGTVFAARIESPDGTRSTMKADLSWDCEGLFAAVRTRRESSGLTSFDTVLRIPFSALGLPMPLSGDAWRANFFRIDRHPELGDEYSAWHPTLKRPADFHVTAAFGPSGSRGENDANAFDHREFMRHFLICNQRLPTIDYIRLSPEDRKLR